MINFNKLIPLLFMLFMNTAISQSILPNTVACMKGSDAHPTTYCLDSTPCKSINGSTVCLAGTTGIPVGAFVTQSSCWSQASDYTCFQYTENCLQYSSDALCSEVGSKTCTQNSSGNLMASRIPRIGSCMASTRTFSCKDPSKPDSASTTMTTTCDTTVSQTGLNWTTTTASAAGDFVQAATAQEFARQIVVYGTKDTNGISGLFPGHSSACADGDFGLKNCCKSSGGGAVSNHDLASKLKFQVVTSAFSSGASYAVQAGSTLVWDSIISSGEYLGSGLEAMAATGSTVSTGFGMYGVGTTASSAGGMAFGEAGSVAIGESGLYFNPYALALMLAIQLVMDAMSCTQDEMDLANAKQKNFCHYVGSYCSKEIKMLGVSLGCLETSQTYCCYNGLLAKAIQEGAHQQLGISWGPPQSPACSGLSVEQLQALDFSTTEMGAFMAPFQQEIMAGFNSTMSPALSDGSITSAVQSNATSKGAALCLQSQMQNPSIVCP